MILKTYLNRRLILEKSSSISKVHSGLKKYSHYIFLSKLWYFFNLSKREKIFPECSPNVLSIYKFVLRSIKILAAFLFLFYQQGTNDFIMEHTHQSVMIADLVFDEPLTRIQCIQSETPSVNFLRRPMFGSVRKYWYHISIFWHGMLPKAMESYFQ